MWRFEKYSEDNKGMWNEFVAKARNSTFLFNRDYVGYHSDRFTDSSLLAYEGNKLLAVLPANITPDNVIHSHQGLSYGGWILPPTHMNTPKYMEMWNEWLRWCVAEGLSAIDYKPLPEIYASMPSSEDRYALFRSGAETTAVQISTTIDLATPGVFSTNMKRHLKHPLPEGVSFYESDNVKQFVEMLGECLHERHGATPVHTASELRLLKDRFPDNIRIYAIGTERSMEAAVCMYLTDRVAHSQYIATTHMGRENNLLPHLFARLIEEAKNVYRYFDFGISTEDNGNILNEGLARQKCSFGGSATTFTRHIINL